MTADPARDESATDRAAEALRTRILEGALLPGTALREVAMAAELAVSRNTLREALRMLRGEGLVLQEPHSGAVVRTLDSAQVRDIYRARRVLEIQAAQDSALIEESALGPLENAVLAGEAAHREGRWRAVGTASVRFHQALVATLDSPKLDEFFRALLTQLRLAWSAELDEESFQSPWAARDRELYELLARGSRTTGVGALLIYLDDSERQVLDVVRRTGATRRTR
ncbi:GntR family transcriptional regulator [Pseudonocardia spinosispora]|uniref:GntR family transcriptional regulator n=1 Tax=Pseudonocardia spinosispora TaxID=103441 RepID=UPI000400113A|nr:GntR family transcriptional regulator [Pseudonocardia spinosispora]